MMHDVLGWRCAVCGTDVDLLDPAPWRCPRSSIVDRRHVLHARSARSASSILTSSAADHPNPFVRHDVRSVWAAAAAASGMTDDARRALVLELDDAVRAVDGVGFVSTPFARSDALSERLGLVEGGVWVKDETGGVGGSQKARHLCSILLHLRALEVLGELGERPSLAIASCGNAALAAATLAHAAEWPIDVFVPTWMSDGFGDRLDALGATVHRCERRSTDPPGDPAMLRFREAVDAGAIPFTVQGPENALCLDGGRTIGWELAEQSARAPLDAVFVQVGGGAFATCLGRGMAELGAGSAALFAVQAEGCAPLATAWRVDADAGSDWSDVMRPWPDPASAADGILDDETYDWIGVLDAVRGSGGDVVVAPESLIVEAHELARAAGFDVSITGSAGLAGLLTALDGPESSAWRNRNVAVVMSGRSR